MPSYSPSEGDFSEIRNDEGLCFSDSDKSSKRDETQSDAVKDYWFGKKYFECVLAQKILEENAAEEMLTVIDSKLEIALQEFNYSEGFHTLRTFGLKSPQSIPIDPKQTIHMDFLSLMGSIVRQGSDSEQRAIKAAICEKGSVQAFPQHYDHKKSAHVQHDDGNQNAASNLHPIESDIPDIALYTMALKQQGDILGVSPSYIEETVRLAPSTFKVTVKFQDIASVGFGRTKKLAKHEASKVACKILGLKVS